MSRSAQLERGARSRRHGGSALLAAALALVCGACVKSVGPSLDNLPPRRWVRVEPGGFTRCAHDTKFAFWVRRGTVNKLLFYFQGGGGCWDARSCAKGSRLYTARLKRFSDPNNRRWGVFAMDDPRNPFRDWHAVVVPSCTGDVYFGDKIKDYRRRDGGTVRIHHRGFANGRAALDWAAANVESPDTVFLTGCSAGSAGSIFFAPHVIERYRSARVVQLGDSLSFAWHRPGDLDVGYGAGKNLPAWARAAGVDPRRFRMSRFIAAVARHYPQRTFAQFNTRADRVQSRFYRALGGPRGGFPGSLRRMLGQVHAAAPNFRSFTAAGGLHCVLPRPQFYSLRTAGRSIRDWVAELAEGKRVPNVQCPGCGVRTGAARSGDPGVRLRILRPSAPGPRSKAQVRRVLQKYSPQVRFCYMRALVKNPTLQGKVVVHLVIAPSGRVGRARVTVSELRSPEVHRCIERRALRWRFPPSRQTTVVNYPYRFRVVK